MAQNGYRAIEIAHYLSYSEEKLPFLKYLFGWIELKVGAVESVRFVRNSVIWLTNLVKKSATFLEVSERSKVLKNENCKKYAAYTYVHNSRVKFAVKWYTIDTL